MSEYSRDFDMAQALAAMERRLAALETAAGIRRFTTATRPAAASMTGAIILNTTTGRHQGSNGTSWLDL